MSDEQSFSSITQSNTLIPLIVNASVASPTFKEFLGSSFKIRESTSTPIDSIILPRCSVAILLANLSRINTKTLLNFASCIGMENEENEKYLKKMEPYEHFIERVKKFVANHGKSYIMLVNPVFGEEEMLFISKGLQMPFLPNPPHILLSHGEAQVANLIQQIAKMTLPETKTILNNRMNDVLFGALSKDTNRLLFQKTGLSYHDSSILIDTYGTIGATARATAEDIHQNTPLELSVAQEFLNYLAKDILPK